MENAYLQLPVEADCSNDHVPVLGQHKAKVMDGGITMTKYLFSHYRLTLYSFLNQALRDGTLSRAVGFKVLNKRINREVCSFPMGGVSFWKIDREDFYADVKVELKLQNKEGERNWEGFLVCMVSFKGEITFSVRNDPRFVESRGYGLYLTEWARAHVDECCLRFVRVYVQERVGKFVLGRMYYDADYIARTSEFLEDIMRAEKMDEIDAKMEFKARFPRSFIKAFDLVMKTNGYSRERTADEMGMHVNTLSKRLNGKPMVTLDFIVCASLLWRLPDWISSMLLDRAGLKLSEYDRRHQAIEHILHVLWSEGREKADQYLRSMGLDPLSP